MLDTIVRLLAQQLSDSTNGANAIAARLPRHNLGGAPDDAAPPAASIINDADDEHAAQNIMSVRDVPALVVWGDSDFDIQVKGYAIAKDVAVGIAFVTDDSIDPITANRACGLLMRASKISLARLNLLPVNSAARTLNGVQIERVIQVQEQRITAVLGGRKCWGFLLPHVGAVDVYSSTMLGVPQL